MKVSTGPQAGGILRRIGNYTYSPSLLLGAGNFSKVYSGRNQTTGQAVAVKVVELQTLRTQRLFQLHRTEMDVLMKISHPHVLKCHQIINDDRHCFIVTEVCNGGDLDMFVKREGFLTEEKAAPYIKDVFEGLMYLSEVGVVHRDLKVANIFLHKGRAKIADFGFALFARQKFRDMSIGSPLYMSPEGFIDCVYGPKTDVWGFGIMIFELLHGDTPYSSCKLENDLRYQLSLRFDRSKVKGMISNELKEVIFRCLEVDEGKRISIMELKDSNYLRRLYYFYSQQQQMSPTHEDHRQILTPSSPHQHPPHHGLIVVGRSLSNDGFNQLSSFQSTKPSETHPSSRPLQAPSPIINNKPVDVPPLIITKPIQALPPSPISDRPKPLFLQPPRDVIRLGRPISTEKQMNRLQPPQASRERLKSIDSKKPVQKDIILTTVINFKAAVNLLHYCRGLFRCVQLMVGAGEGQSELKYLTGWLILILQELNRKLNQGEVLFDGENGEMKAKKLRQVRNEYERKYVNELKNYISSFINKPSLQDIKLYFFLQYRKYDIAIQQPDSQAPLQLGHLVVLMYDGTRLLKKCQEEGNFARFLNYKDIQHMLGWTKDKFTLASYLAFKKRMIINA